MKDKDDMSVANRLVRAAHGFNLQVPNRATHNGLLRITQGVTITTPLIPTIPPLMVANAHRLGRFQIHGKNVRHDG